ncbi:hypothetical protein AAHA92_22844 [Salvia divinorum]|uniref:Folate receptor-like domain-containing protein n=1 Tax=Salvia divinorum TaxID=28513 RepID=A0ABD1GR52_SALDI
MRRLHHFCIFLFLNFTNFYFPCAYGKTSEVCISPGGRFPPFSNVGKPPRKQAKGGAVGVQRGPPEICASFCDRVYEACSTAYFAMDGKTQVLAPCGQDDFVCGRASGWVSNGTELCNAAGFSVKPLDDPEESWGYGGKSCMDYIANSWKSSRSEIICGEQNAERISWAVGGIVLTAGLMFASRRKSCGQWRTQAAIQRSARRLGIRISPPASSVSQGNRKTVGK